MGNPRSWFTKTRMKFRRTTKRDVVFLHSNTTPTHDEEQTTLTAEQKEDEEEENAAADFPNSTLPLSQKTVLSLEEAAAIKIQACFRGHLARRAFRALRSLVKLQALARGVCVRRQARIALHFMHALVRLQVSVRSRQLLNRYSEESDS